jgi:hypothetical protein
MAFKMNPISPLLKSIGHQTPQAIKPAVSSPAKQTASLDPNNTASVTSVSTIKSSKKGDKSKLKRKETSVVVSTGAYSKKRVSKMTKAKKAVGTYSVPRKSRKIQY